MQQPLDGSWLYPYAETMSYVYYTANFLGLCFYVLVVYYTPKVARQWRHKLSIYSLCVMVLNVLPFGYWFITLLSFRTLPSEKYDIVVAQYPSVDLSLAVFITSCLLHFVFSFCACSCNGCLGSKDDTVDYMLFKYNYPKEVLRTNMAALQLQIFPVDHFEGWLALQPEVCAGVPARDNLELVNRYMNERRVVFNRAIAWQNDFQCRRDWVEFCALRDPHTRLEYVCDYDKIREMRL